MSWTYHTIITKNLNLTLIPQRSHLANHEIRALIQIPWLRRHPKKILRGMTLQNSLNSRRHSSSTPPVMPLPRRPYQRLTLYHHPSHETESLPLINPFYTVNMPFVSLLPIVHSCHHPALRQIPEKINMKPLRPNQESRSPYPLHKRTFMRSPYRFLHRGRQDYQKKYPYSTSTYLLRMHRACSTNIYRRFEEQGSDGREQERKPITPALTATRICIRIAAQHIYFKPIGAG